MSTTTSSSSLKDPSNLFYQSTRTRRLILASYWVVVILTLPLWWYTTSIERLSLPSSRVAAIRDKKTPFEVHLHTMLGSTEAQELEKRFKQISVFEPGRWDQLQTHVHADGERGIEGPGTYTVDFNASETTSVRDRHISIPAGTDIADIARTLSDLLVPFSGPSDTQDRVVQYAPRYRLAFTLLNEDAAAGNAIHGWDIQASIARHLSPILRGLSLLHNFTIESQVQFHAPLAFKPQPIQTDNGEVYGLTQEDLTVFVNSAQWTLSSSVSNDPVLHCILFVPSVSQRPLFILNADGTLSQSNAFLMPQWGGIVLYNPPRGSTPNPHLNPADLASTMHSFTIQLLDLLGVPRLPNSTFHFSLASSLTGWQLDALVRRRVKENVFKAKETLDSIIRIVDQIGNMPVGADVRGDVEGALDALENVFSESPRTTSTIQTLLNSAKALTLSSRAFFNPGMLALLYFPAEHKAAVYTPLFASIAVPLIAAAVREIVAWRRGKKETEARRKEKGKMKEDLTHMD